MLTSLLKQRICSVCCPNLRKLHVANRKELIPLIKHIHPDLTAHLSDKIRAQNMSCIQNLNDMWDTLENNLDYAASRNQSVGMDVKFPFRPRYDLTCYVTPKSDEPGKEAVPNKVSFSLNISECMLAKQTIPQKSFAQSVEAILIQQGRMFALAGLRNPWEPTFERSREEEKKKGSDDIPTGGLSDELETLLFEKWMAKNHRANQIGRFSNRAGRSNLHKLYNPKGRSQDSEFFDPLFGNRKASEAFFEDEADAFIQRGNVVVAQLSPKDELLGVKKLRKMIIDYGDVLNFSYDRWHMVYILLYAYRGKEKYISVEREYKRPQKGVGEHSVQGGRGRNKDSDDSDNDEDSSSVPKVVNGGYVFETHGQQNIVRVPFTFSTTQLLEFLGRNLPAAQLVQRRMDSIHPRF